MRLGRTDGAPWVDPGGARLDLSGVVKGIAVDAASATLSERGVANHLVDVGGEVRVAGAGPEGLWTLGVDVPGATPDGTMPVTNTCVATAHRSPVALPDGTEVHKIMDPRTGRPSASKAGGAVVLASSCGLADGLATAAFVLGPAEGQALLDRWPDVRGQVVSAGE